MDEEFQNKPKFILSNFFSKNKSKLITLVVLLLGSIIIIIITMEFKKNKNIDISKKYNKARILIENKNNQKALKILEKIVFQNDPFYSPSALNLIVDNNLIKDKTKILSYFDEVITNGNLDLETKNLYIFKKIVFIGDDIKENKLLSTLNPIIKSNSLWKNTLSDYIKKYYLSKGEFNKAREFVIPRNQ